MVKKSKFPQQLGKDPHSARVQPSTAAFQIDKAALAQLLDLESARPIIESLEAKRTGSRLLSIVYNDARPVQAMLTPMALMPLGKVLSYLGKVPQIDVFLRSTGGIAEVPWRIVTMLREFTDRLAVIVPSIALSGATHIAIAGDELVMSPFAVLGSVDPTRNHPLLPKNAEGKPIPTSVEDLKHCLKFIREQLEESYPQQNLALIISELFKYINPLALGALEQSYNLSKLISEKSLKSRQEALSDDHINDIVNLLAGGYFSHSFLISRSEVETDLRLPVTKPDTELSELISRLEDHYLQRFQRQPAPIPNTQAVARLGAVIQLADKGWAVAQVIKPDGQLIADPWIPFG